MPVENIRKLKEVIDKAVLGYGVVEDTSDLVRPMEIDSSGQLILETS